MLHSYRTCQLTGFYMSAAFACYGLKSFTVAQTSQRISDDSWLKNNHFLKVCASCQWDQTKKSWLDNIHKDNLKLTLTNTDTRDRQARKEAIRLNRNSIASNSRNTRNKQF